MLISEMYQKDIIRCRTIKPVMADHVFVRLGIVWHKVSSVGHPMIVEIATVVMIC